MKMVTKLSEHLNNLLDFKVAKDVKTALEGSGFENMLCLADQPKLNGCLSLTTYLASIYDAKHMCFKISSDINLYLSLEDVLYIWGLPIVGLPIIMVEEKTQEIVERLFPNMGKEVLKIQNLKKIAIEESNELDHRVRATVLYLIGSVCAPNKDKYVSGVFGAFLEDIEMIKHYSWGELLLVGVHEALMEFSGKDINGSMFTLLIFMILHVKPVRRIFDIPEDFTPTIWPVIKEVAPLAHSVLASSSKIPTLKEIRRVMKDCTIDDIIWQPYSNVDITAPYDKQRKMAQAILPIFKNQICVIHSPHVAQQQFNISKRVMAQMKKFQNIIGSKLYRTLPSMRGTGNKNYHKLWENKLNTSAGVLRSYVMMQNWLNLGDDLRSEIEALARKYEEISESSIQSSDQDGENNTEAPDASILSRPVEEQIDASMPVHAPQISESSIQSSDQDGENNIDASISSQPVKEQTEEHSVLAGKNNTDSPDASILSPFVEEQIEVLGFSTPILNEAGENNTDASAPAPNTDASAPAPSRLENQDGIQVYKRKYCLIRECTPSSLADQIHTLQKNQLDAVLKRYGDKNEILRMLSLTEKNLLELLGDNYVSSEVMAVAVAWLNSMWDGCSKQAVCPYASLQLFNGEKGDCMSRKLPNKSKEVDMLFFPICLEEHWIGIVFDIPQGTATLLDSLAGTIQEQILEKLFGNLKSFLVGFHEKGEHISKITTLTRTDLLQQSGTCDCSLFLIQYMEQWGNTIHIQEGYRAQLLTRLIEFELQNKEDSNRPKKIAKYASVVKRDADIFLGPDFDKDHDRRKRKSVYPFSPTLGCSKKRENENKRGKNKNKGKIKEGKNKEAKKGRTKKGRSKKIKEGKNKNKEGN